jgi:DNA replicative helicase MCM subunit Mcm2 (Cdc46/Mcm family)
MYLNGWRREIKMVHTTRLLKACFRCKKCLHETLVAQEAPSVYTIPPGIEKPKLIWVKECENCGTKEPNDFVLVSNKSEWEVINFNEVWKFFKEIDASNERLVDGIKKANEELIYKLAEAIDKLLKDLAKELKK